MISNKTIFFIVSCFCPVLFCFFLLLYSGGIILLTNGLDYFFRSIVNKYCVDRPHRSCLLHHSEVIQNFNPFQSIIKIYDMYFFSQYKTKLWGPVFLDFHFKTRCQLIENMRKIYGDYMFISRSTCYLISVLKMTSIFTVK